MIDWDRVTELREEIGAEDFGEVVDLFLEEVDEAVNSLRRNCPPDLLEGQMHFLKGSALNLGFRAFADLCQRGEFTAASGKAADIDLAEVIATYDKSRTVFLNDLATRFAA